ncbi:hypothetical protein PC116_g10308, partial [Phytophthora cactorum]
MVKLFCAIVGEAGSAFEVKIDDAESVSALKEVIAGKLKYTGRADKLQLFLAKKDGGAGAWLTEKDVKEGVSDSDTSDLELLDVAGAPLNLVGLSVEDVRFQVTKEDVKAGKVPVHVLVVVPEQEQQLPVESVRDSAMFREASSFRKLRRDVVEIKEALASLPHKQSKSYSDAALGQIQYARLERSGLIIDAAPIENAEPFWTEKIQDQAKRIKDEAVFDAFITPYFSSVLCSCDLKPDGFATHRGMYRRRDAPHDQVQRPDGLRFGEAEKELFDCLILFESKISITKAGFGQVVRYLENLCPKTSGSAILFDRESFWLINSYKAVITKIEKAKWVGKGSKQLFQNFITDNISPWVARLSNACSALGVDVVEGEAFLGRGAYGRVFKVIRQDGTILALKVVEIRSVGRLHQEAKALTMARDTGLTVSPVGELI